MLQSKRTLVALFLLFAFVFAFLPRRWTQNAQLWVLSFLRPAAAGARAVAGSAQADAESDSTPALTGDRRVEILHRENSELRQSLVRLHSENIEITRKLQAVTQLAQQDFRKVPRILEAGILVAGDASDWHSTFILDRGSRDGIEVGQAVVWGRHLVGRVVGVGPYLSRVRTIVDPGFRMRARVARPPQPSAGGKPPGPGGSAGTAPTLLVPERLLGLVEGDGKDGCELVWILAEEQVQVGDIVVSVEENRGRWPGGLVFGSVIEASTAHGPYYRIRVQPGVDLRSLTSVFVLKID